ncbi:hypothetical protein [Mycolicibacterium austroafricanum]|uniref:hypothetical protein n=1 Tax=Mycolicibacterium austroafricanum TaxID=39687 RepID=UPI001ABF7390|nr:hypothetical protein [Mycolicibacterium austroafricanum]QRZ05912.1 hypothetical protein JN090_23790 [Mycolicibacterium austroafricanum]
MDEQMSESEFPSAAEVIAASLNTEIVGHSGDYNGGRLTYSRSLGLAIQGLDALREAGWELVRTQEPLWRTDTSKGWKILIGGEPEDVYRRGDVITVSGSASFEAEDVPDLVAALLSAVSQDGEK